MHSSLNAIFRASPNGGASHSNSCGDARIDVRIDVRIDARIDASPLSNPGSFATKPSEWSRSAKCRRMISIGSILAKIQKSNPAHAQTS